MDKVSTLFTSKSFPSGMIKRVAEILQDFGLQRSDWDNNLRIETMVPLLIQKFNTVTLSERLLSTGNKILIEGNEWNDTFWGVTNGNGRNALGRILMEIRLRLKDEETNED